MREYKNQIVPQPQHIYYILPHKAPENVCECEKSSEKSKVIFGKSVENCKIDTL